MKLRIFSLADVVVVIVVAVALFLPPRALVAAPAGKADDPGRRALAFAEARVAVRPDDGNAVYELVRLLGDAKLSDWAVQAAAVTAERGAQSPTRWRALLAVSIAHVDRYEAKEALDYATQALAACGQTSGGQCPSWEQVRIELYQRHLDAGVRSGIDPRTSPIAFRQAGEAALRHVRTMGTGVGPQPPPPRARPAPAPRPDLEPHPRRIT